MGSRLKGNSVIAVPNLAWMASTNRWSPSGGKKVIAGPPKPRLERTILGKERIGFFVSGNSPNALEVRIDIWGGIIVDEDVGTLKVNATAESADGENDTLFKGLRCGALADTEQNCQVSSPKMKGEPNVPFLPRIKQLVQFVHARVGFHADDSLFGKVQQEGKNSKVKIKPA